jgi:hypothetical protein
MIMTLLELKRGKMETILQWGGLALLALLLAAVIGALVAYPTMLLWNAVIPSIFSLPTIDFFQALALNLICSIFFKSSLSSSSNK